MWTSVEFYVIAAFVAAAVIGFAAMPRGRGEVRSYMYGGDIEPYTGTSDEPELVAAVDDHGRLCLERTAIEGVWPAGAYSVVVKVSGFDVVVEERLTADRRSCDVAAATGRVVIKCLGQERYHIQYRSEATGRSAAFSLNIRPGNTVRRLL